SLRSLLSRQTGLRMARCNRGGRTRTLRPRTRPSRPRRGGPVIKHGVENEFGGREPFLTGGNRRPQERRRRLDFGIVPDWAGHARPPATTRLRSLADARIKEAKPLEPPGRSKTTRSALSPTRIAPEPSGSARRRPRRAISKKARAVGRAFIRATRYANSTASNREGPLIIAL